MAVMHMHMNRGMLLGLNMVQHRPGSCLTQTSALLPPSQLPALDATAMVAEAHVLVWLPALALLRLRQRLRWYQMGSKPQSKTNLTPNADCSCMGCCPSARL